MPVDLAWDKILKVVYYLPTSLLFYALLFLFVRYLYRRIPQRQWQPPQETNRFRFAIPIAIAVYLSLTILYFLPYLSRLGVALIGPPEDNMRFYWNLWYSGEVLHRHCETLLRCNIIGFPEGVSMLYHSYSYYNLGLSALMMTVFNPVLTYNLLIMHTFVVGGVGAFLLGRYLLRDDYLALVVGFIFAFSPFHFARALHHLNICSLQFVPFFVLFYTRAVREHSLRYTLLGGLVLTLDALCSWNFLILDTYFIIFAYVYLALRRRRFLLKDVLARSALMFGIVSVLLSFVLVPMLLAGVANSGAYKIGHADFVADLAGFVTPNAQHWLGRFPPIDALNDMFFGNELESAVYMGVTVILVILTTIRHTLAESSRYALVLIACLILSMGRWIYVYGWEAPVILPYNVLASLPFFSNLRAPSRHMVYAYLFLAILTGIGLRYLYRLRAWSPRVAVSFTALSLIIVADYYSYDKRMTPVALPSAYEEILQHGDGAILDLPEVLLEGGCQPLLYQTLHELPIVNCPIARKLDVTLGDRLTDTVENRLIQLTESKVRYIVVHKQLLGGDQHLDTLLYDNQCPRLYTDDSDIVYCLY